MPMNKFIKAAIGTFVALLVVTIIPWSIYMWDLIAALIWFGGLFISYVYLVVYLTITSPSRINPRHPPMADFSLGN